MAGKKTYSFVDEKKKAYKVQVEGMVFDLSQEADRRYRTSRSYVDKYRWHLWNKSIKDYMMYTGDRAQFLENWQSNVSAGLVRSTIDSYQSFLLENPFSFNATALTEDSLANRQYVQDFCNYVADVTDFRPSVNDAMVEGLVLGNYCFKTVYLKTPKKKKAVELINDVPYEVEFSYDVSDVPFSRGIDIYKVFPDPYAGQLRYVTERDVVSTKEFIRLFETLVSSKDNKSPFRNSDLLRLLAINPNGADFEDYGKVRDEVFRKMNDDAGAYDSLTNLTYGTSRVKTSDAASSDSEVTKNLVEYKITTDDNHIVLIANNYPVYVGKNPYGKINYDWGNAYHTLGRYSEGLAQLIAGFDAVSTSFLNALIDGAKHTVHPNYMVDKNLVANRNQLKNMGPGDVIWTDGPAEESSFRRIDKGTVSDSGILNLVGSSSQLVSGVSDYTAGVSARERVATAVSALVESTNRRITGYVKRFSYSLGGVAQNWLNLAQKYWTKDQWVYVFNDGEQLGQNMNNQKLKGAFRVSLTPETFLGVSKESEIKRYVDIFNLLAPTGIINSSEWAKDIIRASGKNPSKFVVDENVVVPENKRSPEQDAKIAEVQSLIGQAGDEAGQENMATPEQQELAQAANSQIDLGNGGQGQPS